MSGKISPARIIVCLCNWSAYPLKPLHADADVLEFLESQGMAIRCNVGYIPTDYGIQRMDEMLQKTIKVWLDDEPTVAWRAALHPSPEWTHSRWPEETIELLKTGTVRELSLDHDLGDTFAAITEGRKERTGYDVALWIEDQVKNGDFDPPVIRSHSQNGPGRARIEAAAKQIALYHSAK